MEHEFKIIIKYKEASPDNQESASTTVYIDDMPVGYLQNIKITANTEELHPHIEATFPTINNDNIAPKYFTPREYFSPLQNNWIEYYINIMSKLPNTKVSITDVTNTSSDKVLLREIGTNGIIDHIDIKPSK